jgi:glycosyltransferase involved in cell wall biosynthesis
VTARKTRVLSIQTPLLGHQTYARLLRAAFAHSEAIDFDAHWSTESHDAYADRLLERQLDRVFLKMVQAPFVRRRNLDFFPLRYELGTSYWAHRTLLAHLRECTPDVVHIHTQALAFLSAGVMARVPTILSADGIAREMAAQQLAPSWRWTFAGNALLERIAFGRARAIVAFSRWAADGVVRAYGVERERVHVIPPGVDLARFPSLGERSGRPATDALRILFIGGEFERKGGPALVEAFLRHLASDERVELHVVTRSDRVPAHPRIIVHARIDAYSPAWFALLASADVFAMPTRRDQSPNVFPEAMAAGLPIVATPVGSATETVLEGETGFIVPAGDAAALAAKIATLLYDPSLRARFGAAARARVERSYDARKNAARLEALFVRVAAER